jgi:hypothetical protein
MENNIEQFVNKIINGDCVKVMNSMPEKVLTKLSHHLHIIVISLTTHTMMV